MNAILLAGSIDTVNFFPFSLTRSVADMRCGILTIREKWNQYLAIQPRLPEGITIPDNCLPDKNMIHLLLSGNQDLAIQQATKLQHLTDILKYNAGEIRRDFKLITKNQKKQTTTTTKKTTKKKKNKKTKKKKKKK